MKFLKKLGKIKIGPVEKKLLLLLAAGVSLGLSHNPNQHFRILKNAAKEWRKINERSLREAIWRLYQSNLIGYKENEDKTVSLTIAHEGEHTVLTYNLDTMKLKTPSSWDGLWRIIMFDIPEGKKKARDAFSAKMKILGIIPLQKSVFIYPYDCRKEIEFITEVFELKPYVRYVVAKEVDVALDLKKRFDLQ